MIKKYTPEDGEKFSTQHSEMNEFETYVLERYKTYKYLTDKINVNDVIAQKQHQGLTVTYSVDPAVLYSDDEQITIIVETDDNDTYEYSTDIKYEKFPRKYVYEAHPQEQYLEDYFRLDKLLNPEKVIPSFIYITE